mgnify:CR=1 FL=1|tara:strand:- start:253 stop:435 length:183 start_codon:yes stop_codon:yes gene_type:complete
MQDQPTKRPDDIVEDAKQEAAKSPGVEVSVALNEREVFKVTYNANKDQFECSRAFKKTSQ